MNLITSPSEVMKDVALAPDYRGPMTIVALEVVSLVVIIVLVLSRFNLIGVSTDVSMIWATAVNLVVGFLIVVGSIVYAVFWLVKSFLARLLLDSGSGWTFSTAASVTGYAYLADLIVLAVYVAIIAVVMPVMNVDVSLPSSEIATRLQSQIGWINPVSIPLSLLGLIWKSYLGGLGTHYGTEEKCSIKKGFVVFLVLALIGWAISFYTRGF